MNNSNNQIYLALLLWTSKCQLLINSNFNDPGSTWLMHRVGQGSSPCLALSRCQTQGSVFFFFLLLPSMCSQPGMGLGPLCESMEGVHSLPSQGGVGEGCVRCATHLGAQWCSPVLDTAKLGGEGFVCEDGVYKAPDGC